MCENIVQVDKALSAVLQVSEKSTDGIGGNRGGHAGHAEPWKYRGNISKLQGAIEREKRNLESYAINIRKLKETLTTAQAKTRDNRELHRNEHIRYFTHIEVIFLPLGFAASFCSTSSAPQPSPMISLVESVVAAFGVPARLLASAKFILGVIDIILRPLRSFEREAELALRKSTRAPRGRGASTRPSGACATRKTRALVPLLTRQPRRPIRRLQLLLHTAASSAKSWNPEPREHGNGAWGARGPRP